MRSCQVFTTEVGPGTSTSVASVVAGFVSKVDSRIKTVTRQTNAELVFKAPFTPFGKKPPRMLASFVR